jgi:hypothetical protein
MAIQNFDSIRADGLSIPEGMTVMDIAALGEISRVFEVRWLNDGQPVQIENPDGIFAAVLPDRETVVSISAFGLDVLNSDGSVRYAIPNEQLIAGSPERGRFMWFEPASNGLFGVIFERDAGGMQHLEIDPKSGATVSARYTR